MARPKRLEMGMINITIQPHKPQKYVDLFETLFQSQSMAEAFMNHKMFLGRLSTITDEKPLDGLAGEFYRFFNLDKKSAWMDVAARRALKRDEASQGVKNIPENLKPDASMFQFVFYPANHRLVFTLKGQYFENSLTNPRSAPSISPDRMVSVLNQLFSDPIIEKKFGKVDITAEPRREKLDEILSLKRLQTLKIELTRPNPDDFEEIEQQLLKRLDDQNVDRQTIILHAATGKGIQVDPDTKKLAKVAASNGRVDGQGYDDAGRKRSESTISHPHIETVTYNPKLQLPIQVLVGSALAFVRMITGKKIG